jgi:chitinase
VTPFSLPPKRILVTAFIPSAWLDDALIAERKAGLSAYLQTLIQSNAFKSHPRVLEFLSPLNSTLSFEQFNPEDAVPSTLSRKAAAGLMKQDFSAAAVPIAAAYYPDWSFGTHPPQSLDYSKFSILFFGWYLEMP